MLPDSFQLEERLHSAAINECCHIVYTSGATGYPKGVTKLTQRPTNCFSTGVMLSHDNVAWTCFSSLSFLDVRANEEIVLSHLPLEHISALIFDLWASLIAQVGVKRRKVLHFPLPSGSSLLPPAFFFSPFCRRKFDRGFVGNQAERALGRALALEENRQRFEEERE